MIKRVTILPISDLPGFAYEVNWTDEDGETTSIDARDLDEVIATLRDLFDGEAKP